MKTKLILVLLAATFLFKNMFAQNKVVTASPTFPDQPKLVIGIVVDQMRADYIYRYWNKLGNNGFKRLLREGFECKNTQYNYSPTYTGPGHASIYSGTTPAVHGIIANDWYDRSLKKTVYCARDNKVYSIGGDSLNGQMSPHRLISNTIGDELRLFSNFKSKVIGISLKDRGSIFPAGHSGRAYWFDNKTNNFITSSYYLSKENPGLPEWLQLFNKRKLPDSLLNLVWKPSFPIARFTESISDDNNYERILDTTPGARPVFNYELSRLKTMDADLLRRTPFGNTITKELAIAAIDGEKLGSNGVCDMLAVSFSSTDYVGHAFGTHAIETEDTYIRLDKDIADFLVYLDKKLGKGNVLLFLTADHAAVSNPVFLNDNKMPGGFIEATEIEDTLAYFLKRTYNDTSLISWYVNDQLYFNDQRISEKGINLQSFSEALTQYLLSIDYITDVISRSQLENHEYIYGTKGRVQNGFYRKRSGDLAIIFKPGYIESYGGRQPFVGTTHGSPYRYDTQVPLIWYGWKIKQGSTAREINITDIAPTVSTLLHVYQPDGCTGKPIEEITK